MPSTAQAPLRRTTLSLAACAAFSCPVPTWAQATPAQKADEATLQQIEVTVTVEGAPPERYILSWGLPFVPLGIV